MTISFRTHLRLCLYLVCTGVVQNSAAQYFLVGTYTKDSSEGVCMYHFDTATATATLQAILPMPNPSFVAVDKSGKFAYAVNELPAGKITSMAIREHALLQLSSSDAMGSYPCYVSVHPSGNWIVAGNYGSGNLTLFGSHRGTHTPALQSLQHCGSSVHPQRQNKPHVHATLFTEDGSSLLVTDLGLDKVYFYRFNRQRLQLKDSLMLPPGSGPRHLATAKNTQRIYVLTELTGNIHYFENQQGKWQLQQTVSTLPPHASGSSDAADIHISPDGKYLYSSNRGAFHHIAIFRIDEKGMLTALGHQPTLGFRPRNFSIHPSGKFLLAANQDSNEIVIFERNIATGLLTDSGNRIQVGQPVCITWINAALD